MKKAWIIFIFGGNNLCPRMILIPQCLKWKSLKEIIIMFGIYLMVMMMKYQKVYILVDQETTNYIHGRWKNTEPILATKTVNWRLN